MKAHIRKQAPEMVTYLELNKRFGYGYQARMVMGDKGNNIVDSVLDSEPYTLEEIMSGAAAAIEEINRQTGYGYELHKVVHITDEAVQINKGRDLASMRVARDIERGRGEFTHPAGVDCKTIEIDGREEPCFTGRGVVLVTYFSWLDDKTPKAREALTRYCEHLAMHGYGGGASDILAELDAKDKDTAISWIKATYGKYVEDDRAIINYMLG